MLIDRGDHCDRCRWCGLPTSTSCENPAPFCDLCMHISALVTEMDARRKIKQFDVADEMRKQFIDMGLVIENTPMGSRWRWKNQYPFSS